MAAGLSVALALACRARAESAKAPDAPGRAAGVPPRKLDAADGGTRKYVVAAMGDSLTDPKSHGGLYLRYLAEACPESRFDSYGKGGEMVNQMRRRFTKDVFGDGGESRPAYTHVIVFGGVNDLYSDLTAGRTVKKISDDLSKMYEAARSRGSAVVAITVAPWGGFARYYNASRAETTRELNRWILSQTGTGAVDAAIDATPLLSCGDSERLCPKYEPPFRDGLHFGPEGHKRLAEALRATVFRNCR